MVVMAVSDCGFECLSGGVSESDMMMLGKRNWVREREKKKKRVERDGGEWRGEDRKKLSCYGGGGAAHLLGRRGEEVERKINKLGLSKRFNLVISW